MTTETELINKFSKMYADLYQHYVIVSFITHHADALSQSKPFLSVKANLCSMQISNIMLLLMNSSKALSIFKIRKTV